MEGHGDQQPRNGLPGTRVRSSITAPGGAEERLRALELPAVLRRELAELLGHDPALEAFDEARVGVLGTLAAAPGEDERAPGLPAEVGGFRVTGLLGCGAMGVVYRGVRERQRSEVAIKVLHALSASPEALRRFDYEAEILARLDHPCVAKVFHAGFDAAHGDVALHPWSSCPAPTSSPTATPTAWTRASASSSLAASATASSTRTATASSTAT